ncbi:MAG TPA: AraC family transcriptional regulator [Chthoniobacteraceae bacterium]|nr:AraC family transcriptional regulator [Chthoniobacteraceae bacterium]
MRRSSPSPSLKALSEAAGLARQCPQPADFFSGRPEEPPLIPANILCFTKASAQELVAGSQRHRRHHRRHVLVCALEGDGVIDINGVTHSMQAGRALLIFPFEVHYYLRFARERICWLYITFDLPHDARIKRFKAAGPLPLHREGVAALGEVLKAWLERQPPSILILSTALLLTRLAGGLKVPPPEGLPTHDSERLLRRVDELVVGSGYRRTSAKELAAALGISASLLRSWFHRETGMTLGRHLLELRLQQAFALLAEENRRIGEIAELCGFASVYSFSRAFKKARGISPSDYRRELERR